jgi:hypothetical protein
MNSKSLLALVALCALGIGFLVGAYQSTTSGSNLVKADPYDEPWYRYGMYNNSYYGAGMGMGMGMCMNGPMGYGMYNGSYYGASGMNGYGYGMNNGSYYGGMGMGGMGMMGSCGMMGGSMNGYYHNTTGYMATGSMGGCPMMGMMSGYNSMPNYNFQDWNQNSAPQRLIDYNGQVISLLDNTSQQTDKQNTATSPPTSPLLIGGIGIALLALAPLSWKILQKYKK